MLLHTAATCECQVNLLSNVTPRYFCVLTCNKGVLSIKTCGCTTALCDLVENHITLDFLILNCILLLRTQLDNERKSAFSNVDTVVGDQSQQIRQVSSANCNKELCLTCSGMSLT